MGFQWQAFSPFLLHKMEEENNVFFFKKKYTLVAEGKFQSSLLQFMKIVETTQIFVKKSKTLN